jgi:hypothetical protein
VNSSIDLRLVSFSLFKGCASHEAALTYARRYAVFTLVGIAGEDDLDAPDLDAIHVKTAELLQCSNWLCSAKTSNSDN